MWFSAWPHEYFIEIQAVQMMKSYGDMTYYGHATIIGVLLGKII